MKHDDAQEYTEALGQVFAGGMRLAGLADTLGVPAALGISEDEWLNRRLTGAVKLSIPERRRVVAELHANGEKNRAIARALDVTESTIRNDLAAQECAPEPDHSPDLLASGAQNCAPGLSAAHRREVAALPPVEQNYWLDRAQAEGLTHRQLRAAIAARPPIAPPTGTYPVLLADPPWRYDSQTPLASRAPTQHYPTMSLDEIRDLAVPAAANAVLFCWAVPALVAEALAVLEAWGFEYRSQLVWVKDKIGLGYWVRSRHELLLVAVRGKFSPPAEAARPDSVIQAPRGRHSQKPAIAYELIERAYPDLPRIELFARQGRPGWDAWGNDVT